MLLGFAFSSVCFIFFCSSSLLELLNLHLLNLYYISFGSTIYGGSFEKKSMQIGQFCSLDNSHYSTRQGDNRNDPLPVAFGFIIAQKPHLDNPSRILYYFRTAHIKFSDGPCLGGKKRSRPGAAVNVWKSRDDGRLNRLHVAQQTLVSPEGYFYRFDGWYDALFLYPSNGEGPLEEIPNDWLSLVERNTTACEVRYLCYTFSPWFPSPFHALQYLALPEKSVCYSVLICHRCLTPFFSEKHLAVHLEAYCELRGAPGTLIYDDTQSGKRVWYLDGAQHLHYTRCISLLGNCLIESKLLSNDVDIYEFFIVTLPRTALPYVPGDYFESETEFKQAAASYDKVKWAGNVFVGYFSRLKHKPYHTLSCIVALPMFQRMRLGSFMLDVAYNLMTERGKQCGCEKSCGRLSKDGGCISRPFSPHGEALLLSYWRRSLQRLLQDHQRGVKPGVFASLEELRAVMDIPIAGKDLVFLLTHDDLAFYSGTQDCLHTTSSNTLSQPAKRTYKVTLVFDEHKIDGVFKKDGHGNANELGEFQKKWLRRNIDGSLCYSKALFHY